MPINPNSRLRKTRTAIHGWKADGKFYTSLKPRADRSPRNEHVDEFAAVAEAAKRHLPLIWEKTGDIG